MYDVAIIGAGIAGICTAYELTKKNAKLRVVLIDKGYPIDKRACPILMTDNKCKNCKRCSIMSGFGGAGGFSDGKYNITTEYGGDLHHYIEKEDILETIKYVDRINMKFGATEETFSTYTKEALEFEEKAEKYNFKLLHAHVKHIGTEENFKILQRMYKYLSDKIDILCHTEVEDINFVDKGYLLDVAQGEPIKCKYLVVAPGRCGADWFFKQCKKLDIPMENNCVDIGVRVELPREILDPITDIIYEAKLKYKTKTGEIVRTFCMNPGGHVVTENTDGIITVNGHSFQDPSFASQNTNFALLVSNEFSEPFDNPYGYGKGIASLSNFLNDGLIVQRYGDLKLGKRTNLSRLQLCTTIPTLGSAIPGNLGYVIPGNQLDAIIQMIENLDKVCPGVANDDTLLYGIEVKFYSARPLLSKKLETKYENMFAIGDGAGITRGLAQAGASGIIVAKEIQKRRV